MKKTLKTLTEAEARQLLAELYALNAENKMYINFSLNPDNEKFIESFYVKIDKALAYSHTSSKKWNFREAKRILAMYKKISHSQPNIADLYVYTAEEGNAITMDLGDIDGSYYTAMENLFEAACKHVSGLPQDEEMRQDLADRLKNIVNETSGIGWGYHDTLVALFNENFD